MSLESLETFKDSGESPVLHRLRALRGKIKRRLLVYGLCAVLAGGLGSFLVVVVLDWLFWFPSILRISIATLFFAGFVGAMLHWLVRPLRQRLDLPIVAANLEARFVSLQGRLSSTVDFLERGDAGSPSLMRKVIANTERIVADIPLESALTLRPLLSRVLLLVVCSGVLLGISASAPNWVRTGWYRYVYPWGEIQWPRTVSIRPLTGDLTAAVGESVTLRLRIQRGLGDSLRPLVHLREHDGRTITLAMQRESDDTFYATVDAVTENLTYWFEAGDDDTKDLAYGLRVVRRPEVAEAIVTLNPPPYAGQMRARMADLFDGPVRGPMGGRASLAVRAGKPIPQTTSGPGSGLRTEEGDWIPLVVSPDDPHRLTAEFPIDRDRHFSIELRDEFGFENRGAVKHSILAIPDAPPVVTVIEPKAMTEVTPTGAIELLIRIADDFGVASTALVIQRSQSPTPTSVDLTDRLELLRNEEEFAAAVSYTWNVSDLALHPGDLLTCRVEAVDNRDMPQEGGQMGRSAPISIKIISAIEFDTRVRNELASLEKRVRQTAREQGDLLDRTVTLFGDTDSGLDDLQRGQSDQLGVRQGRLVRKLRELAGRFLTLSQRMERNHAGDAEMMLRVSSLYESLRRVAGGPMTQAAEALGDLRETLNVALVEEKKSLAINAEERALDGLKSLLHLMAQWGSFHELVSKTRDLIDRQDELKSRTAGLGRSMLGKKVSALTESEAIRLRNAARRQEQLNVDIQQLLTRIGQLAQVAEATDPSTAEAMDAALRTARSHDVTRSAEAAAKSISENRTAAATIHQSTTAEALRKVASALRDRERRELDLLRKRLDKIEEQVAFLIGQQTALRDATHEAGLIGANEDALRSLEEQQRRLKRNAKLLGEDLAEVDRAAGAARLVRQAATPMGRAEGSLREHQADTAVVDQDSALAMLSEALEKLEELAKQTQREAMMRSLAQIREALSRIRTAQLEVNPGVVELVEAVQRRGRISRTEARLASKLARQQGAAATLLEQQRGDFEQVVVFAWALERVAEWMDSARSGLSGRRIDDQLVATTQRIIRELDQLIEAIAETESLPVDTEFVETEQAGHGGGQGGIAQSKPVPTVAELFVLRSMQKRINARTDEIRETFDPDIADEEQLREIRAIGEDQTQVGRLADLVTQRAREE